MQERYARVLVLFGIPTESPAARHAHFIVVAVRNCQNVLRYQPRSVLMTTDPTTDPGLRQWNTNFSKTVNELDTFSQAARREIRAGPIAAARRRLWNGWLFRKLRTWHAPGVGVELESGSNTNRSTPNERVKPRAARDGSSVGRGTCPAERALGIFVLAPGPSCSHNGGFCSHGFARLPIAQQKNPPFPAGFLIGAPRFELGTSSPPD
jgi:hypothetical protein